MSLQNSQERRLLKWFYTISKTSMNFVPQPLQIVKAVEQNLSEERRYYPMTKNQIEFLKLKETQRANQRTETLTEARDRASRELGFAQLGETSRHNLEQEALGRGNLAESERHNKATEAHQFAVLGETQRHNLAQEAYNSAYLGEVQRSNLANEQIRRDTAAETARHNRVSEDQTQISLGLQATQTDTQRYQAETSRLSYLEGQRHNQATEMEVERSNRSREEETKRSNLARESETVRSNSVRESETTRHNVALESLERQRLGLGYAQLAEQQAYHTATVGLEQQRISETYRSNLARELETSRSNLARETETSRANRARESIDSRRNMESVRSNQAREKLEARRNTELQRHNREEEAISQSRNAQGWLTATTSSAKNVSDVARTIIPLFGG